jgi:hypothetical protein
MESKSVFLSYKKYSIIQNYRNNHLSPLLEVNGQADLRPLIVPCMLILWGIAESNIAWVTLNITKGNQVTTSITC